MAVFLLAQLFFMTGSLLIQLNGQLRAAALRLLCSLLHGKLFFGVKLLALRGKLRLQRGDGFIAFAELRAKLFAHLCGGDFGGLRFFGLQRGNVPLLPGELLFERGEVFLRLLRAACLRRFNGALFFCLKGGKLCAQRSELFFQRSAPGVRLGLHLGAGGGDGAVFCLFQRLRVAGNLARKLSVAHLLHDAGVAACVQGRNAGI